MSVLRRATVLVVPALLMGVTACGSDSASSGQDTAEDVKVTGVPQAWLDATEAAWKTSDSRGESQPTLESGAECLTYDGSVAIAGAKPETTAAGFGGLGGPEAFRYVCSLRDPDHYAGNVQLLQVGSGTLAEQVLENSMDDTDTSVQENDVTVVQAGGVDIHVLTRWYPTNPQGMYQALYVDPKAGALVGLEINSLDEKEFKALSEQDVADTLAEILTSA